jgi:hypothetical protein
MSWASRRRFIILSIIGGAALVLLVLVYFFTLHKAPSCSDGIQNQTETGIDCGGACAYLCTADVQSPTVLFTKAIPNGTGRTDVIASVENVNATAGAKQVPYTLDLYGANQVLVKEVTGTLDLPPSSSVPVFIPGITSGNQSVVRAFLTIAGSAPKWYVVTNDSRIVPVVSNTKLGGSPSSPRIDAMLTNSSVSILSDVRAVAMVRDESGEVIAASQTIVPAIPPQGQSTATFTWNSPFSKTPASIEIVPVIPLP